MIEDNLNHFLRYEYIYYLQWYISLPYNENFQVKIVQSLD
jgi:hypothetical protein